MKKKYSTLNILKNKSQCQYDIFLQKIKGNVVKNTKNINNSNLNIVKDLNASNYQNYLNSKKSNIKKIMPGSNSDLNCNCSQI